MRSLIDPSHSERKLTRIFFCALVITTALLLGFTSTSGAQAGEATTEDQKLISGSDAEFGGDNFGFSVAVHEDTMVVGAPLDGDGAAYVFARTRQGWQQQQRLMGDLAELAFSGSQFGSSVAINNDTIVVGAPADDGFSDSPNVALGLEILPSQGNGAVYLFERDGSVWERTQKLTNTSNIFFDDLEAQNEVLGRTVLGDPLLEPISLGAQFGTSVAIEGDTIVVGAPYDEGFKPVPVARATNPTDLGRITNPGGVGAAYVFERNEDGTWDEQQRLHIDDQERDDLAFGTGPISSLFGLSVAIEGNTIVVGAPLDIETNRLLQFVLGEIPFPSEAGDGAAYIFELDEGAWQQTQRLASETDDQIIVTDRFVEANRALGDFGVGEQGDQFGYSVAIEGNVIAVGAILQDNDSFEEGAVHLFTGGDVWTEDRVLTQPDPTPGARFGRSVAIDGESIVVGAPFANSRQGAAYVFTGDGFDELIASDIQPGQSFGFSIATSAGTIVAGTPFGQSDLNVVIQGLVDIPTSNDAGAAYVFDLDSIDGPVPPASCNGEEVTVNMALGEEPTDGDDVILGTDGPDLIMAGDGNDIICAGDGDDLVSGGQGGDVIFGGEGNDELRGNRGKDVLHGNRGDDFMLGGKGADSLRGGKQQDILRGNNGNDVLVGGNGADMLDGGSGRDSHNGGGGDDVCVVIALDANESFEACES